jgi:hypothetical protein
MKVLKKIYLIVLIALSLTGCDFIYKNNGTFGSSQSKEEAKKNGAEIVQYLPNKNTFKLIDSTVLLIDTAWTEMSFTYKNGERFYDSQFGYIFNVPFKKEVPNSFTFSFELLDKSNQEFTNGIGEDKCELRPKILKDTLKIILEQKNTEKGVGWISPIITDTIVFRKIR